MSVNEWPERRDAARRSPQRSVATGTKELVCDLDEQGGTPRLTRNISREHDVIMCPAAPSCLPADPDQRRYAAPRRATPRHAPAIRTQCGTAVLTTAQRCAIGRRP